MKNNKKILIIIGGILVTAAILLYFLIFNANAKCENISGGSFDLVFNTNGGKKIPNMHVCIACPPDSYEELKEAKKDGYIFAGWYYDSKFKHKVSTTSSLDIITKEKKNKKGCIIGYENITLYAKWEKEGKKTLKVIFDSIDGTDVQSIEVKCDSTGSATLNNLPKPIKNGYTFVAWLDKNENPILDEAKIVCDGELKLKASWNKLDETDESSNDIYKQKYTCNDGYTLNGTKCTKTYDAPHRCSDGLYEINGKCIEVTLAKKVTQSMSCTTGTKMFLGYDVCKTDERISVDSPTSCTSANGIWINDSGECYEKGEAKYSCPQGYEYLSNPGQYNSAIHGEAGCYPVGQMRYTCTNSRTDKLEGTKCITTVDAKLN